jgi:hypothetical protein
MVLESAVPSSAPGRGETASDAGATGPPARPYQPLLVSKLSPAAPEIEAESESAQAKAIELSFGMVTKVRFMVLSTGYID